jgi:hypothetical protein
MQTCPVCETPVVASPCDVCGHVLPGASPPEVPVSALLDLEVAVPSDGPTPVVPLPELEPTRFAAATLSEDWSEVEWERSQVAASVPDIAAGGLADLDSGREAPSPERTPPSVGPVTCRYCRNVQASGLLCERCGLRLPRNPGQAATARVEPEMLVRCQQCGERTFPQQRCASCGAVLATEA